MELRFRKDADALNWAFLLVAILMNSVLMIMLIRREAEDLGTDVGTESYLIMLIYAAGIVFLFG